MIVRSSQEYFRIGYIERPGGVNLVEVVYAGQFGYDGGDKETFSFHRHEVRGNGFFENDPRYNRVVIKQLKNEAVSREVREWDRSRPFDPTVLKTWDADVLKLLEELPDYVLDVIGYHEVFPKSEDVEKVEVR
ncbi:MAG TPA: hypothetical protein VJA47_05140 [archaeon]|nr:hypothetical protein [archaeon]